MVEWHPRVASLVIIDMQGRERMTDLFSDGHWLALVADFDADSATEGGLTIFDSMLFWDVSVFMISMHGVLDYGTTRLTAAMGAYR